MGSPPPGGPGLHQSPAKTYSQAASPSSNTIDDRVSKAVRFAPIADLQGGVASVDLPKELLSDSEPLWSAYIVGHFMGDAPHIGKVHAIVNRIWSFPEKPVKIDAQFISPKTVLFRIDNPQLKARVLKRNFWHIADVPIVVREWSPKTASANPDLTAVPLWVDLRGVPDHLFSQNGLTFFGDTIGRTVKLHPNTERCVRLDVARLLVVMNLEEPLPLSISVRGTGETLSVSYPWLPPRCLGCQTWGHTDKSCPKNKKNKEEIVDSKSVTEEEEKIAKPADLKEQIVDVDTLVNVAANPIDIEEPVMEVSKLNPDVGTAQKSSTKRTDQPPTKHVEGEQNSNVNVDARADDTNLVRETGVDGKTEEWLTIPQSNSPSARQKIEINTSRTELPTCSPSRYQVLSNDLEEGEVEGESSEEETSVESQAAIERRKQLEKQKSGKTKKSQKSHPNTSVGKQKDQSKGAKNKQTNHASSRRH